MTAGDARAREHSPNPTASTPLCVCVSLDGTCSERTLVGLGLLPSIRSIPFIQFGQTKAATYFGWSSARNKAEYRIRRVDGMSKSSLRRCFVSSLRTVQMRSQRRLREFLHAPETDVPSRTGRCDSDFKFRQRSLLVIVSPSHRRGREQERSQNSAIWPGGDPTRPSLLLPCDQSRRNHTHCSYMVAREPYHPAVVFILPLAPPWTIAEHAQLFSLYAHMLYSVQNESVRP
jgi:hypothetical protein